ncbi:MAG: diguanylate cyclase [Motiliproteus sp.]
MINPSRYLITAILSSLIVTIVFSFLYQYRAINDLKAARLQTDQAISNYLPEAVFALIETHPRDVGAASAPSQRPLIRVQQQQLALSSKGLDIIALELLSLQQTPILVVGERPDWAALQDPAGFEKAKQGTSSSRLVSLGWVDFLGAGLDARYTHISQIGLSLPGENGINAVVAIYSDLSAQVWRLYLTQLMLSLLLFCCLNGLNLFLHRRLKQDKGNVQRVMEKESKALRKADYDPLTGLPNRALLNDRLKQAVSHCERFQHSVVVMFLDLDGFKAVNDTLGHHVGDQLLNIVAKRLKDSLREGDTVARLGGDEFVVVLPMFDSRYTEQASEVAQRILESLAAPMSLPQKELQVGCSIGVSRYPDDGKNAKTLLKNADSAMYQAKEQGRNNVQFYSLKPAGSMSAPANLKSNLEQSLQRQEFKLLFQPQLDLKSEKIAGVSAFLYWFHPRAGMNLAEKLLPAGKKNSPALGVGQWLLNEACLQRMRWQQQGVDCGPLTVYLKANLFEFEAMASCVSNALDSSQLDPQYLELELTDCLLDRDLDTAISLLNRLRSLGVGVSIDGAEFSLNAIRQLPLSRVRIGHRTISQVLSSGADSVVVRAIIALAHQLSLPVIAEGVDSPKQKAYLGAKGCDHIQGICTSPPQPNQELIKRLRHRLHLADNRAAALGSSVAELP